MNPAFSKMPDAPVGPLGRDPGPLTPVGSRSHQVHVGADVCVLVGGGIRKGPGLLELFQTVVNLVHWHQPEAAIAFSDSPGDSPDWVLKALEQKRKS